MTVTEKKQLLRSFSKHYINIVESSCGTKPTNVAKEEETEGNKTAVKVICESIANHKYESIKAIDKNSRKNRTVGNTHLPTISASGRKAFQKY